MGRIWRWDRDRAQKENKENKSKTSTTRMLHRNMEGNSKRMS